MEDCVPEDTFKILVATDIHLGYGEKKPIIDQDSFKTFEEILQIASTKDVDFVLLGGDLFHESQPSPYCIYKCTELLRKYCLGDKPVSMEFLSDQSDNFKQLMNPVVNYEDPNVNISIPVFSIHGNHDNPAGTKQISALDILSALGLVNYFGRWTDLSRVDVRPILLQKGKSQLALYGLSHIPDQRLARLFQDGQVNMARPETGDWFHLLVLHQNRADRGAKNFIPSSVIPDFIELVIWGHEHDCRITPAQESNGIWISQPGSSVATSLAEGEACKKHVGLLKICKNKFQMEEIALETVRPFLYSTIELINPGEPEYNYNNPKEQSVGLVKDRINEMILKAAEIHTDTTSNSPLPLIRINVKYHMESQVFNPIRVGHEYETKVANPADIIKIRKAKPTERKTHEQQGDFGNEDLDDMDEWATRVEDVVRKYFESHSENRLMSILSAKAMTEALSRFVDKSDSDAVNYVYELQKKGTLEKLISMDPDVANLDAALEDIKQERANDTNKDLEKLLKALDDENRSITKPVECDEISINSSDDEPAIIPSAKPTRGRGRGSRGGRGYRSATSAPRSRGKAPKS